MKKPLRMCATRNVVEELKKTLPALMVSLLEVFKSNPMDMYVVEDESKKVQIRAAGYLNFDGDLDEESILKICNFEIPKPIWFKVDDYGDQYVGTILFPSEY